VTPLGLRREAPRRARATRQDPCCARLLMFFEGMSARAFGLVSKAKRVEKNRRKGDRTMRLPIHAAIAFSVALMAVGSAEAAKRIHKSHQVHFTRDDIRSPPGPYVGNAAAGGNNANSMSGSNSAVENANGRTNCC